MTDRNLNPHAEARVAMAIWSHEYAYEQKGGSMDFWDSRTAGQKAQCVEFVDKLLALPRADGTQPVAFHLSSGWPDPLKSPQAEAIRAGKIDMADIVDLFDKMEREIRVHRGTFCETESRTHTPLDIERAAQHCEQIAAEYETRAIDPACENPDHYRRAAEKERQEARVLRSRTPSPAPHVVGASPILPPDLAPHFRVDEHGIIWDRETGENVTEILRARRDTKLEDQP